MIKPKHYIIFAIIWFAVIVILSVIPDDTPNTVNLIKFEIRLDYLLHFLIYLPLGFALMKWSYLNKKKYYFLCFISLFLFMGIIPEIVQLFIPYRTFNPYDLLFNLAGVLSGIIVVLILSKLRTS